VGRRPLRHHVEFTRHSHAALELGLEVRRIEPLVGLVFEAFEEDPRSCDVDVFLGGPPFRDPTPADAPADELVRDGLEVGAGWTLGGRGSVGDWRRGIFVLRWWR